ncbi:MAG: putative Fe-S cluster assembly protein SufT [Coxiellaceae bacterium]|jgi:probable FeS assembly SUF system protein SufT|nr:putative Fe-S cluster assembly protein SufT [Coxiellaceae bacterium]
MPKTVKLKRDVNAIQIPFGTPTLLPKNTEVTITHSLGGSHTVTVDGTMYRIDNRDADALDEASLTFVPTENVDSSLENKIWMLLRTCYDPEIPVNIVDLGLIYGVNVTEATEDKFDIKVRMTLTAPGCGMGPVIVEDAKQKILNVPEVNTVEIEIVFDPPWDRSMMSEQAKLELGLL